MAEQRYRFGPRDTRGLLAGWSGAQLAVALAGLAGAVVAMRALSGHGGIAAGAALGAAALALPRAKWAGRSGGEWLALVSSWRIRRFGGRNRRVMATLSSARLSGAALVSSSRPSLVAGGFLGGLRVEDLKVGSARFGAVADERGASLTAVISLGSTSSLLAEAEERARLARTWAALLSSAGREGAGRFRLQWIERALPASLSRFEPPTAPESPALGSYRRLLAQEAASGWSHESYLAVSVRVARGSPSGAPLLLAREVRRIVDELYQGGISVLGVLPAPALSLMLRCGFETSARLRSGGAGSPAVGPWPLSFEESWRSARTDGTWHASFWVAEWPRVEVGPDFLAPLLCWEGRRAMSVVFEPVGEEQAARRAERSRAAELAEAELARRNGFLRSERRRREAAQAGITARELAAGHVEYRFSGYVCVSADDEAGLEPAAAAVEGLARHAGLDLRRLYGRCGEALSYVLPCGRGIE